MLFSHPLMEEKLQYLQQKCQNLQKKLQKKY